MNLQVERTETLVRQVNNLAVQPCVNVTQLATLARATVNWQRGDKLLAKVPAQPPLPGAA